MKEIKPGALVTENLDSAATNTIQVDTVIISMGLSENRKLYEQLRQAGENAYLVGDARGEASAPTEKSPTWETARRLREAISDGFEVAMRL